MAARDITLEDIQNAIRYDAESGRMYFMDGSPADRPHIKGYYTVRVKTHKFLSHRVAWLLTHGEWPAQDIDHINRVGTDNRLVNLRAATRSQNQQNRGIPENNSSGCVGVAWNKRRGKWMAYINSGPKRQYLGAHFSDLESAVAVRKAAEKEQFGEWAPVA